MQWNEKAARTFCRSRRFFYDRCVAPIRGIGARSVSSGVRKRRFDGRESSLGLRSVGTAGLSHVAASASALATELLGADAHESDRVVFCRQVVRNGHHDAGLAVIGNADDGDDAGAEALLAFVGEALEILHLDA